MHFEMFGASVLVGLMSGWLAGIAMKSGGYGLLWDIVFGLSGSVVGSWIFQTLGAPEAGWGGTGIAAFVGRSEEHTSELQSHSDLVCRLLLEKKKKKTNRISESHDY